MPITPGQSGSYYDGDDLTYKTITEEWDGNNGWTLIDGVSPGVNKLLQSVWFTKEGDLWASGNYTPTGTLNSQSLLLHWNDIAWEQASPHAAGVSSQLAAISTKMGDSAVVTGTWAVGSYSATDGVPSQALVEQLQAPTAPISTTSYYETSVDQQTHSDQGKDAALKRESGVIMLNYGEPKDFGANKYSSTLIGTHTDVYIDQIESAVESFADGYHNMLDTSSTLKPTHITITVSINNDNLNGIAALTSAHATEWAKMVSNIYSYLVTNNYKEIGVAAGMDIHPVWSSPTKVTTWLQGYFASPYSTSLDCYNFGTTDGYPYGAPDPIVPPPMPTPLPTPWTVQDLYNVSSQEKGIQPFPRTYKPTWSREWYRVKRWAWEDGYTQSALPRFTGASAECQCGSATPVPGSVLNPEQAWQMLQLEVNTDPLSQMEETVEGSMEIKCSSGDISKGCSVNQ